MLGSGEGHTDTGKIYCKYHLPKLRPSFAPPPSSTRPSIAPTPEYIIPNQPATPAAAPAPVKNNDEELELARRAAEQERERAEREQSERERLERERERELAELERLRADKERERERAERERAERERLERERERERAERERLEREREQERERADRERAERERLELERRQVQSTAASLSKAIYCVRCRGEIPYHSVYTRVDDEHCYHQKCFTCSDCNTPISGQYFSYPERLLCASCDAKPRHHCFLCSGPIATGQQYLGKPRGELHLSCFKCENCYSVIGDRPYYPVADPNKGACSEACAIKLSS